MREAGVESSGLVGGRCLIEDIGRNRRCKKSAWASATRFRHDRKRREARRGTGPGPNPPDWVKFPSNQRGTSVKVASSLEETLAPFVKRDAPCPVVPADLPGSSSRSPARKRCLQAAIHRPATATTAAPTT